MDIKLNQSVMINISQLAANKGQIEVYDVTEEEQAALSSVIDKAYDLMEELDAYEESGEDVIKWFYEKYNNQDLELNGDK